MDIIDGKYIDAGKKRLYFKQLGTGLPAVVIEPGWGNLSAEWTLIQYELAKYTTVITYDRAGYAESQSGDLPRSAEKIASELFSLLWNSNVMGPYIFIGHSTGGLYVQQFASMYPDEVAGLVLVDSITENNNEFGSLDAPYYKQYLSVQSRAANLARYIDLQQEDLERFISPLLVNLYPDFPNNIQQQILSYLSEPKFYKAIIDEYEGFDESFRALRKRSDFPNVPLKIICRDPVLMIKVMKSLNVPENEAQMVADLWLNQSKRLMKLSDVHEFIIAEGADHNIHISKPGIVIEKTMELVHSFGSMIELG